MRMLLKMVSACAVLSLLLTGCIRQQTVIKVNEDGSGALVVTTIFSGQAVETIEQQMKTMQEAFADSEMSMHFSMPTNFFYDENSLKNQAALYGLDVTFVKAKPYNKNGARGSVAMYSFEDVNNLAVPMNRLDSESFGMSLVPEGMNDITPPSADEAYTFSFTKRDDDAVLKITPPALSTPIEIDEEANSELMDSIDTTIPPEAMAAMAGMTGSMGIDFSGAQTPAEVMEQMVGDMRTTISLIVNKNVKKTNAAFPNAKKKNRYTLLDVDYAKVFASGNMVDMMTSGDPDAAFKDPTSLRMLPGVMIDTNQPIEIVF